MLARSSGTYPPPATFTRFARKKLASTQRKAAGDRPARKKPPSPNRTHGDEQEHRGHKHGRRDSYVVGGGQIVGLAEEQRQTDRDKQEQPVDNTNIDLPVAFLGRLILSAVEAPSRTIALCPA